MPYKSAKQRAYLHVHEPELAAEWDQKYGGKVKPGHEAKEKKVAKKKPAKKSGKKC